MYRVVELVRGGSVINEATPSSFYIKLIYCILLINAANNRACLAWKYLTPTIIFCYWRKKNIHENMVD